MMVARSVAIDDAVPAAGTPLVVISGAGLDGKRERIKQLAPVSCDIRFVPVDFERGVWASSFPLR